MSSSVQLEARDRDRMRERISLDAGVVDVTPYDPVRQAWTDYARTQHSESHQALRAEG